MTTSTPEELNVDEDTVTITIDGKEIQAKPGELLISAAQRAGVFIPRFCYHDRLKPVGMCRMCLVEIEGVRGMPPACTTPVAEGMNVSFQKENVEKVQDGVLEFLLINHPLDCPVCDRGGECPLQDQTLSFGPGESRFVEEKRHWEKPIEISDHVLLDRERCIQCSRCTRFADDVAGDPLITFVERSGKTEVNTFPNDPFASYFSGNIVQICPVGALTAKPYRFHARPWDLNGAETTCTGCSVGCKGEAQTSRNEMVRFLGVDSEPINQGWLCDKGRYGFDFIDSQDRIRSSYIVVDDEKQEIHLTDAVDVAAQVIKNAIEEFGPDSVAILGGAKGTNEDAYAISRLAKGTIGTSCVDAQLGSSLPADVVLTAKRARISDLDNAAAIISVGCDLKESLPLIYLRTRKAVTENAVAYIEAASSKGSTSSIASNHIDLVPGDEIHCKDAILAALDAATESSNSTNSKIVLIAGDTNSAQHNGSFVELINAILGRENVVLLPAVSTSNMIGAYEMGLAPGLLPGRVSMSSDQQMNMWPKKSYSHDADQFNTEEILKRAKDGKIKVLILFGANVVAKASDKKLAIEALTNVDNIIAVDAFENETTKFANLFIPSTLSNEKDGTTTNLEGRVQRVVQVVAPQGNVYDDWKIATLIAENLGVQETFEDIDDITNEISRVVPTFAHLTTGVIVRARDGAVVPVDDNKDVLSQNSVKLVDTPSWEPIASKAESDQDPLLELEHEEHHPSANVHFPDVITSPFSRDNAHSIHLDKYSLRVVFVESFHDLSTRVKNSKALSPVATLSQSRLVRINPKDLESVAVREDNRITLRNDLGEVVLRVQPDKNVMRGVVIAQSSTDHPLNDLVSANNEVTDVRVEVAS